MPKTHQPVHHEPHLDEKHKSKVDASVLDIKSIKFVAHMEEKAPVITDAAYEAINRRRNILYAHELIKVYPNGIGYGNISVRIPGTDSFYISGTSTGRLENLGKEHYCLVSKINIDTNELRCEGPIMASAESMTHAMIYKNNPNCQAAIHIHNNSMRKHFLNKVPTTKAGIPYGTPEMCREITRLFEETDVNKTHFLAMGGHEDGLMAFGDTLDQAGLEIIRRVTELCEIHYACDDSNHSC